MLGCREVLVPIDEDCINECHAGPCDGGRQKKTGVLTSSSAASRSLVMSLKLHIAEQERF